MPNINCKNCNKEKYLRPSIIARGAGKFCSYLCYWKAKIGTKRTPEAIIKFIKSRTGKCMGENNPMWKGDNVKYEALHIWVRNMLGNPVKCAFCGKSGNNRQINWANKSQQYLRDLKDWIALCVRCHRVYDGHPNFVNK